MFFLKTALTHGHRIIGGDPEFSLNSFLEYGPFRINGYYLHSISIGIQRKPLMIMTLSRPLSVYRRLPQTNGNPPPESKRRNEHNIVLDKILFFRRILQLCTKKLKIPFNSLFVVSNMKS
jgi:hypothetical protein